MSLSLIVLGYVGTAVFYSYLIGFNLEFPYLCPICPDILSLGSPWAKFIGRTVALGTLNAVTMVACWWAVIGVLAVLKTFLGIDSSPRPNE
jgi:hypothetical protein